MADESGAAPRQANPPHTRPASASDNRGPDPAKERRRLTLELQSLRNRRHEIELSDDRAYTNGRMAKINADIRDVENRLARLTETR